MVKTLSDVLEFATLPRVGNKTTQTEKSESRRLQMHRKARFSYPYKHGQSFVLHEMQEKATRPFSDRPHKICTDETT